MYNSIDLIFRSVIPQPISKKKKSKERKKKKAKGSEVAVIDEKVEQSETTVIESEKNVEGNCNN